MNHNKIQAKILNPKKHTKRVFDYGRFAWLLSALLVVSLSAFHMLGWLDVQATGPILTELPATGK